jgi:diguanylate cyclase (GGDEF)-like protein
MISRESDERKSNVLAQFVPGDTFGEFGFITGTPRDVDASAKEDCTLVVFPAPPFTLETLSLERPRTICTLYLKSLAIVSKRLQSIRNSIAENSAWVKQLQDEMYIDHLTRLYTKQFLTAELPRVLKPPVTVFVLKPDHFKDINEIFGHQAGDLILNRVGTLILDFITTRARASGRAGWAIRLQSNEIAVVLEHTPRNEAIGIARFLSNKLKAIGPGMKPVAELSDDTTKAYEEFTLTASISIGFYRDKKKNFRELLSRVYHAMHGAWKRGGNRIMAMKEPNGIL